MWRMALVTVGLLMMLVSACDQDVLIAKPSAGNGDYEVMALVAE
jgi:hypothetical protein